MGSTLPQIAQGTNAARRWTGSLDFELNYYQCIESNWGAKHYGLRGTQRFGKGESSTRRGDDAGGPGFLDFGSWHSEKIENMRLS